jgi:hypothetical protein
MIVFGEIYLSIIQLPYVSDVQYLRVDTELLGDRDGGVQGQGGQVQGHSPVLS